MDVHAGQVNGGLQSFNAVNSLRILGRWMRMITIPNQSSVPKVRATWSPSLPVILTCIAIGTA
jgi:NAD(P)H-dependent FMN reductase